MVVKPDEFIDGDLVVPFLSDGPNEFRVHPVIPELNQLLQRQTTVAERFQSLRKICVHSMLTRFNEFVQRQRF
jgi:hypothetical protein